MTLPEIAAVGAGGALGAVGRHGLSGWARLHLGAMFPFGTLLVNLLGCLLMGFLLGHHAQGRIEEGFRLAAVVGFLGGFTTFSSFAFEALDIARTGRLPLSLTYVALSVVLGIFFVYVGWMMVPGVD